MKYIDADSLRAEIEKRKQIHFDDYFVKKSGNAADYGASNALAQVLSLIDSFQQEHPEEICSKCIHHGKDDDYCYNPHGGMRSLTNENGVYECTGFCEKEQEQPDIDLEKEIHEKVMLLHTAPCYDELHDFAYHFYERGFNARK